MEEFPIPNPILPRGDRDKENFLKHQNNVPFFFTDCTYEYIGCFGDKPLKARAYDLLYASNRGEINWDEPCTDFQSGVEHCCNELVKLKEQKHFFGVQFYGECWTYNKSQPTDYDKYGVSEKCTSANCGDRVGEGRTNAIYFAYRKDKMIRMGCQH